VIAGSASERTHGPDPGRFALRVPRRRTPTDPWTLLGLFAFLAVLFVALFGERLAPHEPIYFVVEHGSDPRPYDPGVVFPFGSDVLGRDIVSLVLAGAHATLTIVVLGGVARVLAGVLLAAASSWWRPTRIATESVAELASAVPATLVALVLVKVFVKSDTTVWVFIGALLVMGWAGPFRVIRAELDRLRRQPFTQGAVAMGIGRWRLFLRHHLPHLVPVIALNLSQQIVASLVLVAELGVLGVFVGGTRLISVEESMTVVRTGLPTTALVTDSSEWGGLLAGARTVEALWTTRWLILVPGVAFAATAIAVSAIGFALARRYARRDLTEDVRGPGAVVLIAAVVGLFVVSGLIPERYVAAREWAAAAREEARPVTDISDAFAEAGLRPLAASYAVQRHVASIVQTGPATARIGDAIVAQEWPRMYVRETRIHVEPLVTGNTGGGAVEAPLVFAARGVVPSNHPPRPVSPFGGPQDVGRYIEDYADDYAGIDVRGKVVLLVRFMGVDVSRPNSMSFAPGPSVDASIAEAIQRGAAAVLFVDPALNLYTDTPESSTYRLGRITGGINPYLRLQRDDPPTMTSGVPVIVLSRERALALAAATGIDLLPLLDFDAPDTAYPRSASRDLGITARVEVPLAQQSASITSYVGEVPEAPADAGHVVVWAIRPAGAEHSSRDVVAAVARALGARRVPLIFVDFDPSIDPKASADRVREVLNDRSIALVLVLEQLEGSALRFTTPYGDLIPALDLYAENAGARHEATRTTAPIASLSGVAPFPDIRTVVVRGNGAHGDLRPDAAAFVGYLAGRLALGAPEVAQ
jgi:peptide/nickel transport system permease protein